MESSLPWFKLVANKDGSVASVERIEGAHDERGRSVHYLQAASKEEAIKIWAAQYLARCARVALQQQAKRAKLVSESRCTRCKKPTESNKKRCADCAADFSVRFKQHRERVIREGRCVYCRNPRDGSAPTGTQCTQCALYAKAKRVGAQLPPKRPTPKQALTPEKLAAKQLALAAKQKASDASYAVKRRAAGGQLSILRKKLLLEALENFDAMPPARFRGWLVAQLHECTAKETPEEVLAKALAIPRKKSVARVDVTARQAG